MLTGERADIALHESPAWCALATLTVILALAALWTVDLPLSLRLFLGLAVVLTLLDAALDHGLRIRGTSVRRLVFLPETGWQAEFANGDGEPLERTGPVVVSPAFVSLSFRRPCGRRLTVPVFADAADPVAFRRFRVFLRLMKDHAG